MVLVIINKYTPFLAWLLSPVIAIIALYQGQFECMSIALAWFVIGLLYVSIGYHKGWWPFHGGPRARQEEFFIQRPPEYPPQY